MARARTTEAYLAGLGATGALLAGAFTAFLMMAGVVTFSSWPQIPGLIQAGQTEVSEPAAAVPPSPQPRTLSVVKLLGASAGPGLAFKSGGNRSGGNEGGLPGGIGGGDGGTGGTGPGGTAPGIPGGSGGGSGEGGPGPPASRGVVSDLLSGAGNAVEQDANSLGHSVNNLTGTQLGDVVGGVGTAVNQGLLQKLAGR